MVAFLEKTDRNAEFHEIIDFLTRSSIYYALTNVPVPLDYFPINALTTKGFSFMVKKGKKISWNVNPLFPSMLAQPTEDKGAVSERSSKTQPTPSPTHPSEDQSEPQPDPFLRPSSSNPIPDSIPEGSSGNQMRSCHPVTIQAAQIKDLKAQIKQLKKKAKRLSHTIMADFEMHKDPAFDDLDDAMDYMETEDAHDEGTVKDNEETRLCTEDQVSTDKLKVSTDKPNEGTAEPNEGTVEPKDGNSDESAAPTTVFRDDETISQFLVIVSQNKTKKKGFETKEIKDTVRKFLRKTGSDDESKGVNEAEKKFKMLANDEEIARKVEADSILAARLQEEEREKFTIEERAKLLYDTIAAQRRFLAQQRAAKIRSRPPTRTQLRNQMMTYLKHVGGKKHFDLKNKIFEEIQVLYEKVKSSDENFIAIGSAEDERIIRELNKKAAGIKKANNIKEESKEISTPDEDRGGVWILKEEYLLDMKSVVKEDVLTKVHAKQEVVEQGTKKRKGGHMKMLARKRKRSQPDVDSDDEHIKCLKIVTFKGTIDSEIMERKSFIARLNKVSSPDGDYLVIYRANGNFRAFNYLMEVLHIFDRQDLFHLYDLVMKQYSEVTPEGVELIL
ncbi:hypothetical protein Tco_0478960 [Tanacetum coccineum]